MSIHATSVSGTVWPQFAMQVLIGVGPTPGLEEGGRIGSEMGPLSSPGTTSYRLPIVTKLTTGLSLTVFAVLRMFQTDRRN